MGNPFQLYTEADIIHAALKSGQIRYKKESYDITVLYTYDMRYNLLLILWYSDKDGDFVLDNFGPGRLTQPGRDFINNSL